MYGGNQFPALRIKILNYVLIRLGKPKMARGHLQAGPRGLFVSINEQMCFLLLDESFQTYKSSFSP